MLSGESFLTRIMRIDELREFFGCVSNALEKIRVACSVFRFEVSTQHVTRNIFQGFKVNETHVNFLGEEINAEDNCSQHGAVDGEGVE